MFQELDVHQLDFGILDAPKSMRILKPVGSHKGNWVALKLDTFRRLVDIQFKAFPMLVKDIRYGHEGRKILANRHYRFQIRFSQLSKLIQVNTQDGSLSLVIPLESPPEFYKKIYDMKRAHVEGSRLWKEWDAWPRVIDIEEADTTAFRRRPANLKKSAPLINIGRWTVFRVILSSTQQNPTNYTKFQNMLRDHNIPIISDHDFKFNDDREPAVWQWIDQPQNAPGDQPSTSHLHDLDRSTHVGMPSEVRYLLEVCISQGKLNEYNLSKDFIDRLLVMDEVRAIDLLDHVANKRDRIFEPMKIFNMVVTRGPSSRTRIPSYCCMIKSARVTPTTIYYSPASVEVSNRVIRRYKEYSDRFLRVKFTDETHIVCRVYPEAS
jgi:RNA-dependent RNA polymerase